MNLNFYFKNQYPHISKKFVMRVAAVATFDMVKIKSRMKLMIFCVIFSPGPFHQNRRLIAHYQLHKVLDQLWFAAEPEIFGQSELVFSIKK